MIFFAKRPKPASSDAPSVIVVNDEETSQKVTKQWTDPVTQRDKEGRAFAEVARLFLDIKSMIQAVQSMMKTTKSCLKI